MNYILENLDEVTTLLQQHVQMTLLTLAIAVSMSIPLGWLVSNLRWLKKPVLGLLAAIYTIPSLALIILLVPLFGLNANSAIAAMVLYSQVILVRNLTVGLEGIDPLLIEAARGMGMNGWQLWWRVQWPLVLPVFLSGVRLAAIVSVAIATVGAKFGAGGLGTLLFDGIAQAGRYDKIWAGAIVVMGLAFTLNGFLLLLEAIANPVKRQWIARFFWQIPSRLGRERLN
ncbi:MAG: ABC transporter permease [Cyanobacteria bacterium P01_E01_bin.34]